jgi:DNA recombination protein RmuC
MPELVWLILAVITGGTLGAALVYIVQQQRYSHQKQTSAVLEDQANSLRQQQDRLQREYERLQYSEADLKQAVVQAQTENRFLQEKLSSQKEEARAQQTQLKEQFQNLANEVLARQREQLAHDNRERLGLLLDPLKERIQGFEKKVEETHQAQSVQHGVLKAELERLATLNQSMSDEARQLTQALKGDNKAQGNWGELVLERILEASGLRRGQEYWLQGEGMQLRSEEGKHQKPDVIISLPEGRHLIIDSKVSLKAYDAYLGCEDEEKNQHLRNHIVSLRRHIQGLAERHYAQLQKLNSPDFVLLFLPIEASLSLALQAEGQELFSYAWERKVVLVSPTTLLATLRTTAAVWKYEKQNRNALQIAEESGKLYDKFYGFVQELEKVGKYMQQGQQAYDEAIKKLSTGKGNLLHKAEKLKQMGISAKKDMENLQLPNQGGVE